MAVPAQVLNKYFRIMDISEAKEIETSPNKDNLGTPAQDTLKNISQSNKFGIYDNLLGCHNTLHVKGYKKS